MKRIIFALTAVACFGAAASQAMAQYQAQPQYRQPYAAYAAPAARPAVGYQAAGHQAARSAYPVQQTAMRPSTNTYAATPTSGYALKPVNPPSPNMQRVLMANRTQPTPAPAPVAAPAAARSNVRLPPSPAQANWGAPPYGSYDNGAANYGSAPMGAGQMGSAPMGAQPDPGQSYGPAASGPAPCEGGNCGGGQCGVGGCGLPSLCGGCCKLKSLCCCCCDLGHNCCLRSTGDLVQHTPFFGTTHGYYYFRPYHVMHVFSQQELATRWGGDPRNPYDNTIFHKTYEMMGVDIATIKAREEAAAKAKAAGLADPGPDYSIPNINSVPTPLPGGYQGTMNYGPQGTPPAAYPPSGAYPPGAGFQGGVIPQGAMPNVPAPSIEYVPQR